MSRRTLTMFVLPALWCLALASAAATVYCKHQSRATFVELERLAAERDQLEIEWGRLQLEQSAWSTHGFVERTASSRLKMKIPSSAGVVLVQGQGGR